MQHAESHPAQTASPRKLRAFAASLAFCALAVARFASAGEWHNEKTACSDCHTQHNSAGGTPMRTDNNPSPANYVLRREDVMALCLSCHDGATPSAPDVVSPVTYVPETAAGPFANLGGTSTTIAHDVAMGSPVIPPGGTIPMILTCTTCHDPHGNTNYRNLRPDPTKTGLVPVSILYSQTVAANGSNPAAVYVPSNIMYKSGVSAWCENCHGAPVAGSDHPTDKTMFGSSIAYYPRWSTGDRNTVNIGTSVVTRVPAHSPTDNTLPSQDDQVMCLSCHKAHGSANYKTLIYADGVTMDSTCQECHNQ